MEEITGNDSTRKIAAKMNDGTSAATVGRWKESVPLAGKVVALCRAYNVDPVEGLMQAGYLTAEEVKRPHLSHLSTAELLAEVARRTR
jgi:hypothetical protein